MTGVWTTIDKTGWGPGPWQDEPDKIHWIDPETDLDCLMVRVPHSGHWCGYVAVADGHPAFGKDYDDVRVGPCPDDNHWSHEPSCYIEVHGGLTFAGPCSKSDDPATGICHVPGPGRPDHVWWLGFDCAHLNDLSPARASRERSRDWPTLGNDIYRDRAYVEAEVRDLARQLRAMAEAPA